MTNLTYDQIRAERSNRIAHYQPMVTTFWNEVTDKFMEVMGPSFHFAWYRDGMDPHQATEHIERSVIEDAGIRPGMRVLDVGCGVGGPTLTIAQHSGAHVVGVNINARQIEIARQRAAEAGLAGSVTFEVADAMQMPFPDASFDHVYLFESGYHMPDKRKFVAECARVLKPGGCFLGFDWMAKDGLTPEEQATYIEPLCASASAPYLATLGDMRQALTAAGLHVEVLRNIAELGDMTPNWDFLDWATAEVRKGDNVSAYLQQMALSGDHLAAAGRAGAFHIGQWRARKPA